jgi:translation initiation factor IF-3
VRLLGPAKEALGVVPLESALAQAMDLGLDLVEINPTAKPPVCRIMDYGKFKFEEKKKDAEARRHRTVSKIKEIKMRPRTDEHDFETKLRHAREFLTEHKVKVTIVFQGREMAHRDIGQKQLADVVEQVKDVAVVESPPRSEGRSLFLILAPKSKTGRPVAG